jgi:hypothetical protein
LVLLRSVVANIITRYALISSWLRYVSHSCCFLPESVGVGSSGALMGMLSSWVVWIIFRWYVGAGSSLCTLRASFVVVVTPVMTTVSIKP